MLETLESLLGLENCSVLQSSRSGCRRLFAYMICRKPDVPKQSSQKCWCLRNNSICGFLLLFAMQFLLLGSMGLFPGFFNKLGCIYVERLAEKVPECIGGIGKAFRGFHYYAFVFRLYNEFVADFNAKLRANAFRYSNLVLSSHFYLFVQVKFTITK